MPLKPHPTDPDKWIYESRRYMFKHWVGLTDEEQQAAYDEWQQKDDGWGSFYALIEAKLKEKNT